MADEDEVMSPAQAALERAEARIAELEARVRAAEDTAARINAARDVEREAAREFTQADVDAAGEALRQEFDFDYGHPRDVARIALSAVGKVR